MINKRYIITLMSNKDDDNKLDTPGISEVIKLLLKFLAFCVLLFLFNLLILPNIKVFPNLPPDVVWRSIFVTFYEILKAIFNYVIAFIVIVWIVYKFVEKYVPNIPFPPIPLKDIVLGFPPFKEFKEIGIIDLLDGIVDTILSFDTPLNKITSVGKTLGNYVKTQITSLADDIRNLFNVSNQETYPNFNFEECIKEEVNRNCKADLGGNPLTMPIKLLKYAMCRFIYLTKGKSSPVCAYKKCINENIQTIHNYDSNYVKAKKRVQNMQANIKCSMKKNVGGAGVGVVHDIAKKAFQPFDKVSDSIDGIIPEIFTAPFTPIFDAVLAPFKLAFDAGDTGTTAVKELTEDEKTKAFMNVAKELPPVKLVKEGINAVKQPINAIKNFSIPFWPADIPIGGIVAAPINLILEGINKAFEPIGGL